MKDDKDDKTLELLGPPKRGRGRPRAYADAAEKQRAYRERVKAEGGRVVARVVRGDENMEKSADWLLKTALDAIAAAKPELKSWCADKLREESGRDRLGALRFVCNSLDESNRAAVADALCVSLSDLDACARVLRAI